MLRSVWTSSRSYHSIRAYILCTDAEPALRRAKQRRAAGASLPVTHALAALHSLQRRHAKWCTHMGARGQPTSMQAAQRARRQRGQLPAARRAARKAWRRSVWVLTGPDQPGKGRRAPRGSAQAANMPCCVRTAACVDRRRRLAAGRAGTAASACVTLRASWEQPTGFRSTTPP